MSYYKNLAKRSLKDSTTLGAYTLGAASGLVAIGAVAHFAPYVFPMSALAGPEATLGVAAAIFAAGAIPGALAGAIVGSTILMPFVMAFHAMTQKRIANSSIETVQAELQNLKNMPDKVIEVVINDIIARYNKSKSFSASKTSNELLANLQAYSHGQDKLQLIEKYLTAKENDVLANNGKKFFRIISEVLTTLNFNEINKYTSKDKTTHDETIMLECPIGGTNRYIEEPTATYWKDATENRGHIKIVDAENLRKISNPDDQSVIFGNFEITSEIPSQQKESANSLVEKTKNAIKGSWASKGQFIMDWLKQFFVGEPSIKPHTGGLFSNTTDHTGGALASPTHTLSAC